MFVFLHRYIEGIMSGCDKELILIIFAVKGEKFCPFQDFQGPQPKFKDFPEPGIFFSIAKEGFKFTHGIYVALNFTRVLAK